MQFRWNRTDRTQKQRCKHHDDDRAHSFTLKNKKKITTLSSKRTFPAHFSYFGKVFQTRAWVVMLWLRNASCPLIQFVLSPWRQQTRPILNRGLALKWLVDSGSDTLWCPLIPRLLIHIYFEAAGVTGQKEKHMFREHLQHPNTHRLLQGWLKGGLVKRILLMWKQVFQRRWNPFVASWL